MSRCVVNVTDHEFDKILQLNHDALVWRNTDHEMLEGLKPLLGQDTVAQLGRFEECRMEKHHDLAGVPRIETIA